MTLERKRQRGDIHQPFLATTSASMMGQPSSLSMEDTELFPEAMPPVSPTRNILNHMFQKLNSEQRL